MKRLNIAVISIGDELLKGKTLNSNVFTIGHELLKLGIVLNFNATVKDVEVDIRNILDYALKDNDIVIFTGGLGPTTDDITVETIAKFYDLELELNSEAKEQLEARVLRFKGNLGDNIKQAYVPQGATVLKNSNGTAPGVLLKNSDKTIFLLPDPPNEMKPMLEEFVIPVVKSKGKSDLYHKTFMTVGVPESTLQSDMKSILEEDYDRFNVCFRAAFGMCELMLFSEDEQELNEISKKIINRLGCKVLSEEFSHPAEEVIALLKAKEMTIGTAESCTGGNIAGKIVDYSGTSKVFKGGTVAYSNEVKISELGVSSEILDEYGAVSEKTAIEMVNGICKKLSCDVGIATTGVAGPDGGTKEKPVGLVYVATKIYDEVEVIKYNFNGNRDMVRHRTLIRSFDDLRKRLI